MTQLEHQPLGALDWLLIGAYFVVVMGIGFYFARKSKDTTGYFLAGRHAGWIAVGGALFAANISSEHFVGLAGTGFKSGFAVAQFELFAAVACMLLGWVFIPFYIRAGVFTMPEFLEHRYNKQCRTYLSMISLISYVLTKISVTLYAGALFMEMLFGWDLYTSSLALVIATGIYTVAGGLSAVIYTELLQAFVLIGGAACLTLVGLDKAGGLSALIDTVPLEHWSMLKPATDPDHPWPGMLFGLPILGIWYWCTDQYIVQRALGAKNVDHARGGALFAGFLKIIPMFLLVFPGIIALKLFPHVEPGKSNTIYPMLTTLLPTGVKGLVIAGLFAAIMSSLAACFNSCGTLFTMDLYKPKRPHASDRELLLVGRVVTVVMVIIGILYVPMMKYLGGSQLYDYLQRIQAYISPPIAAVFLLGLFWKRLNGSGALASLYAGFVLGVLRLALEFGMNAWEWELGFVRPLVAMNFLHFAIVMFAVCVAILVGVSMMTPAQGDERLRGLTFATTPKDAHAVAIADSTAAGRRMTVIGTVLLCAILAAVWAVFYVIVPMRISG
ncbi:MAG: sodium transporter [Planctomycetota bacterium]|nr:MAG: sodium transporter [Planctomycetota bacterium]